ncbi:MAG: alpha-amylase [Candidatus Riflebacteria bacterium]|nr:alpha-amylase [Candidatus Riflebacteria bacterium]
MSENMANPLESLKTQLKKLADKPFKHKYYVPSLWVEVGKEPVDGKKPQSVHPAEFYLNHIEAIEKNKVEGIDPFRSLNGQIEGGEGGSWINNQAIYNMFVRLTTAYDHNGDNKLGGSMVDLTLNQDGIRESGTFLKAIAMLGYIKALGCTTIHLLPITSIGHDGNKGELGSPYGIKNPYKLEETLADPMVEMSAEDQFRAFMQAAHLLGIRVICEFVFRTASKDADWIAEHPDWFYWLDAKIQDRTPGETDVAKCEATYGNPIFTEEELKVIKAKVEAHDFNDLPAPHQNYVNFFKLAPKAGEVKLNDKGQYEGNGTDPITGDKCKVRVPGAFADWPPDDNQPPWGDVTYFKMYKDENPEKPEFNYIAYNTIRMYDNKLARPELANQPLWDAIIDLIPTYQTKYGIDGVMIDMGHAVPVPLMQELIGKARTVDPNFCFLSENFEIGQASVDAGYNAVVGYCWWVEYRRDGMYDMLEHIGKKGVPLSFFGAVENHNTPRACGREGGVAYAKYAFLVNTMLPHAVPFIHAGQELGEAMPVNTGLDFSNELLESLKGKKLALFDLVGYNWDGKHEMYDFVKKVLALREEYAECVKPTSVDTFASFLTGYSDVIAFIRGNDNKRVMVLFNRDLQNGYEGEIDISWCNPDGVKGLSDRLTDGHVTFKVENNKLKYSLKAGQCCFFAW